MSQLEEKKTALEACTKAIAEKSEILISYSDKSSSAPSDALSLANLSSRMSQKRQKEIRGKADAYALFQKHHNHGLFAADLPSDVGLKAAYLEAEKMRCALQVSRDLKGVCQNLSAYYAHLYKKNGSPIESSEGVDLCKQYLPYLLAEQSSHFRFSKKMANELLSIHQKLPEKTQKLLKKLGASSHDQKAFMDILKRLLSDEDNGNKGESQEDLKEGNEDLKKKENQDLSKMDQSFRQKQMNKEFEKRSFDLDQNKKSSNDDPQQTMGSESPEDQAEQEQDQEEREIVSDHEFPGYAVFAKEFDEIKPAEQLASPLELIRLRRLLDQQLLGYQTLTTRLANKLQRKLLAKEKSAWRFDLDDGVLDSQRLTRIVTSPMRPRSFKLHKKYLLKNTVVTLLIDNSGSMRGKPIATAALSADILARTLERCDIKVEILGFTTSAWKGGQSREKWAAMGKPLAPGRLNDSLHVIYKDADMPWRRAKKNLGIMLKEGLLKENIDGEALLWAYQRLKRRPEERQILMVISDGAPVDDSTQSVNSQNYLESHLKQVIHFLENKTDIELLAIGIGHDVTNYYRRSVTIMDSDELSHTMLTELEDLFEV